MSRRNLDPLLVAALVVVGIVACRLWLADALPLTDTTEARFGEMARKMVETGNWLTPQHDYGVPYLAKPPLAMWLSAVGIELFGAGELGPRIPILASTLALCAFVFVWTRKELGAHAAAAAITILASTLLFFVAMAAVMTDMILTACVTTAVLAFWRRVHGGAAVWETTLYVALGLGLLAKGPLAAVLIGGPILYWAVRHGRFWTLWHELKWVKGALLTAAVAVPWYVLAEWKNPGFLNYFLIGEHVQRFLVPGWTGDLYGRAHEAPLGTIWAFFLIGALPWSVLAVPALVKSRAAVRRNWTERRELVEFLAAAALTPLALFTFSGNVIFPYALPALVPAVLAAIALWARAQPSGFRPVFWAAAGTVPTVCLVLVMAGSAYIDQHTQRSVVNAIQAHGREHGLPIYYWRTRYFSADYYSRGDARVVEDAAPLERALADHQEFYLVVAWKDRQAIPDKLGARLQQVGEISGFTILTSGVSPSKPSEPGA